MYCRKDAKFSRNLYNCWCIEGNCEHFDKKLCNPNYNDSIDDIADVIEMTFKELLKDAVTRRDLEWLTEKMSVPFQIEFA